MRRVVRRKAATVPPGRDAGRLPRMSESNLGIHQCMQRRMERHMMVKQSSRTARARRKQQRSPRATLMLMLVCAPWTAWKHRCRRHGRSPRKSGIIARASLEAFQTSLEQHRALMSVKPLVSYSMQSVLWNQYRYMMLNVPTWTKLCTNGAKIGPASFWGTKLELIGQTSGKSGPTWPRLGPSGPIGANSWPNLAQAQPILANMANMCPTLARIGRRSSDCAHFRPQSRRGGSFWSHFDMV